MRVTGGEARGRPLAVPRGQVVRPTSDRVREALFNILGSQVLEARFLDLFAGSGAVGIEALSRGARRAAFVESHAAAQRALTENLQRLGYWDRATVIRAPVQVALARLEGPERAFDLVFLDPPFDRGMVGEAALLLDRVAAGWDCPVLVAFQHSRWEDLPQEGLRFLRLYRCERYGESRISFLQGGPIREAGGVPGQLRSRHLRAPGHRYPSLRAL